MTLFDLERRKKELEKNKNGTKRDRDKRREELSRVLDQIAALRGRFDEN